MKAVPLTRGMVALVDDEDYDRVVAHGAWQAQVDGDTAYARHNAYLGGGREKPIRSSVLMHSFITGWGYVDHRNGDGLDNRRANLRQATHALNMANKKLYRNNTTGFKGVRRNDGRGRPWRAVIRVAGVQHRLGNFDTAEHAAHAYDAAALAAWGEFARTNFQHEEQAA